MVEAWQVAQQNIENITALREQGYTPKTVTRPTSAGTLRTTTYEQNVETATGRVGSSEGVVGVGQQGEAITTSKMGRAPETITVEGSASKTIGAGLYQKQVAGQVYTGPIVYPAGFESEAFPAYAQAAAMGRPWTREQRAQSIAMQAYGVIPESYLAPREQGQIVGGRNVELPLPLDIARGISSYFGAPNVTNITTSDIQRNIFFPPTLSTPAGAREFGKGAAYFVATLPFLWPSYAYTPIALATQPTQTIQKGLDTLAISAIKNPGFTAGSLTAGALITGKVLEPITKPITSYLTKPVKTEAKIISLTKQRTAPLPSGKTTTATIATAEQVTGVAIKYTTRLRQINPLRRLTGTTYKTEFRVITEPITELQYGAQGPTTTITTSQISGDTIKQASYTSPTTYFYKEPPTSVIRGGVEAITQPPQLRTVVFEKAIQSSKPFLSPNTAGVISQVTDRLSTYTARFYGTAQGIKLTGKAAGTITAPRAAQPTPQKLFTAPPPTSKPPITAAYEVGRGAQFQAQISEAALRQSPVTQQIAAQALKTTTATIPKPSQASLTIPALQAESIQKIGLKTRQTPTQMTQTLQKITAKTRQIPITATRTITQQRTTTTPLTVTATIQNVRQRQEKAALTETQTLQLTRTKTRPITTTTTIPIRATPPRFRIPELPPLAILPETRQPLTTRTLTATRTRTTKRRTEYFPTLSAIALNKTTPRAPSKRKLYLGTETRPLITTKKLKLTL